MIRADKAAFLEKVKKFDELNNELSRLIELDDAICEILDFKEVDVDREISLKILFYSEHAGKNPTDISANLTEFIDRGALAEFLRKELSFKRSALCALIEKL